MNVIIKAPQGLTFALTFRKTDTIRTLRQHVAEKLGRPMNHIKLLLGSQELRGDKTLFEIKITDNTQLTARLKSIDMKKEITQEDRFQENVEEITLRSFFTEILQLQLNGLGLIGTPIAQLVHTIPLDGPSPSTQHSFLLNHPKIILAEQQNFSKLFHLLDIQEPIASKGWELISLLSLNQSMIDEFKDISSLQKNIDKYFNSTTVLKLAYSFSVISNLVKENTSWCDKFIELNGLGILFLKFLPFPPLYSSIPLPLSPSSPPLSIFPFTCISSIRSLYFLCSFLFLSSSLLSLLTLFLSSFLPSSFIPFFQNL